MPAKMMVQAKRTTAAEERFIAVKVIDFSPEYEIHPDAGRLWRLRVI